MENINLQEVIDVKKSCLATINFGIQYHHLEKNHAFKHIYPDMHLVLQQWDNYLKVNPNTSAWTL